jgi:nicotinamidase-related amidase
MEIAMPNRLSIDPRKSALLVMDFQITILEHHAGEPAAVLSRTAGLIEAARKADMMVVYVVVGFRPGYPEISPRNRLFSAVKDSGRFAAGSEGTKIHPAVAPKDGEPIVTKHRVSAFAGTDLEMLLKAKGIETLVLAGISTAGVMLSTLRQGLDLDYGLIVARDCCGDSDKDLHNTLLDKIFAQHAAVVSSAQIQDALGKAA